MSVGLLGSPLLAGDARNGGCPLAPVSFAIPEHAVCREKKMEGGVVICPARFRDGKEDTQPARIL